MNFDISLIKTQHEILQILLEFDKYYLKPLDATLKMTEYAKKLADNAIGIMLKLETNICGYIMFYMNDFITRETYITQIAVKTEFQHLGIGKRLMELCISMSKENGFITVKLEVDKQNSNALSFYCKLGFHIVEDLGESFYMRKIL